jgi:hypothetical protein
VLEVVDLNLVDNVLHMSPQEKPYGVKYGDLGGQAVGPPLPAISFASSATVHRSEKNIIDGA